MFLVSDLNIHTQIQDNEDLFLYLLLRFVQFLTLTFGCSIHFELCMACMACSYVSKFILFARGYPVFSAFIEEAVLSHNEWSWHLVKNQLTIDYEFIFGFSVFFC